MSDQSTARRTLTLVFNINDMDAFESDHPNIKALALAAYDRDAPYSVAGLSTGNEVQRSTMIGDVLDMREDRKLSQDDALEMIADITKLYEPAEFDAFDWGELKNADAALSDCGDPT